MSKKRKTKGASNVVPMTKASKVVAEIKSGFKGGTAFTDTGSYLPKAGGYKRCHETHQPLKIVVGDQTYLIHGGSCTSKNIDTFDVMVALDRGYMEVPQSMPWNPGVHVFFPITDMQAPKNADEFAKLVDWLAQQLKDGKKVHAGCIGGHGRTGTLFAALVTHMTGELDSINYVRKHYCKKAVESASQVNFLNKHYGIKKVDATKECGYGGGSGYSGGYWGNDYTKSPGKGSFHEYGPAPAHGDSVIKPMPYGYSIHGSGAGENRVSKGPKKV